MVDNYRPRSRGDMFGSIRVFVCVFVCGFVCGFEQFYTMYWHGAGDNRNSALPSSTEKIHDTQIHTHLPLSVQGISVCVCDLLLFRQVAPSRSITLLIHIID